MIKNPGHIIAAQEVAPDFVEVLRHPRAQSEWRPAQHWVAGPEERRRWEETSWHVIHGDEGEGSTSKDGTCIIAAQASAAAEVRLFEWVKTRDGPYTETKGKGPKKKKKIIKMAQSRILIGQVLWIHQTGGRASTVVATVHLHRHVAKGDKGLMQARNTFMNLLKELLLKYKPDVLTGDFNMALLLVVPLLREAQIAAELVSWFAFVKTAIHPRLREDDAEGEGEGAGAAGSADRSAAAAAGAAGQPQPGERVLDSCGIFSLKPLYKLQRQMTWERWEDPSKLPQFAKKEGAGYKLSSYVGREQKLRESLAQGPLLSCPQARRGETRTPEAVADAALIKAQMVKGKVVDPAKWDPAVKLFQGSGHMPLLAFFGSNNSSRSEEKLGSREADSIRRGWGPEPGGKRSAVMQEQGLGPPPGHEAFLEREERRQQRQRRGQQWAAAADAAWSEGGEWGRGEWGRGWDQRARSSWDE